MYIGKNDFKNVRSSAFESSLSTELWLMKHFPRELSTYRTNSHCGVTNTIKPIERGG